MLKGLRRIKPRWVFGIGFLAAAGAVCMSIFYFQLHLGLIPCTLCELQRMILIVLGVLFLIAFLHGAKRIGVRIYSVILLIPTLFGFAIATYQFWGELLPPSQAPACGPGLNYLLQTLPLKQAIIAIFTGSQECFHIQWSFLGLSIAGWSALFFIALTILLVWQLFRKLA